MNVFGSTIDERGRMRTKIHTHSPERSARYLLATLVLLAGALYGTTALAQNLAEIRARLNESKPKDYPAKQIELMVAFPAGGGMDVHTRLLVKHLEKYTAQNFIVFNRAGASGFIGHSYITTQAKPDGHTLGVLSSNFWADSIQRGEGKWSYRDVEPIAFYNAESIGWLVNTSGQLKDKKLHDIIALAKEKPGELRVAMSDTSPTAFLAQQVEAAGGVKFTHIPFQGGRQAVTALLGGHIEVSYGYMGEYRSLVESGKLQLLALSSSKRSALLPNVPTFNELLGINDALWDAFRFIVAPKGVPAERKAWLVALLNAVLDDPDLAKEVAALGANMDRGLNTPAKVAEEVERRVAFERVYYDRARAQKR